MGARVLQIAAACLVILAHGGATAAEEVSPQSEVGDLVRRPPVPGIDVQMDQVSKIMFLNRCARGCSITPGEDDARLNTSRIVAGVSVVSPWRHGDASWAKLVQCVTEIYAPYDVQVTDIDPGDKIFHHEAIVAGQYTDIGYPTPVGGIALSQCSPANNVISFTFANGFPDNPMSICHTVAQETAHSYGLEHAYDCSDPMTYLPSCGRQFFRDAATPCGEFEPLSQCLCGGNTQNSHRWLRTVLGENLNRVTGPVINIDAPSADTYVDGAFLISATASHMRGIQPVQLFINGRKYAEEEPHPHASAQTPYVFSAPADLAGGILDIEIRSANDIGTESTATVTVQKGEPCTSEDSCKEEQLCEEGRCRFPRAGCGCQSADSSQHLGGPFLMLLAFFGNRKNRRRTNTL